MKQMVQVFALVGAVLASGGTHSAADLLAPRPRPRTLRRRRQNLLHPLQLHHHPPRSHRYDYDPAAKTISREYSQWIRNLDQRIARVLAK